MQTKPTIIVSSGRSGTYSIYKALDSFPEVEARHEPWCEQIQKLGCMRHAGLVSDDLAAFELRDYHLAAVRYSDKPTWISVGNKEAWLIKPLQELMPQARFIWLMRDGRRVCLSYYHKLHDEMYTRRGKRALVKYFNDPTVEYPPPPDKEYWWPVPNSGRSEFLEWSSWRQVCWFYNEICRHIEQYSPITFRLEDLTARVAEVSRLLSVLGLPMVKSGRVYQTLQKPTNVHKPQSYQMTPEQEEVYREMCGEIHEQMGYSWDRLGPVNYG